MFPSYHDLPALNNRIRPDRRHVRTANEIRTRVRRFRKAA